MLSLKYLQENKEEAIKALSIKNFDATQIIDQVIELDDKRKTTQAKLDNTQAEMNSLSKEIGILFKSGKVEEANSAKAKTGELKEGISQLNTEMNVSIADLNDLLLKIPNIPHPSVPAGKGEEENVIERTEGEMPNLYEGAIPHWELAKKYNIIDFELGNKITGAGFPLYRGKGAIFQRALINFFLDENRKAGYEEVIPPLLVNEASAYGTGQLPDKDGQMYHATEDNLYLIPTAEVPVTNIYRDVILKAEDFPIKNTAYSACFRREAGSYGSDVRGLNRLHQFDKVEIVQLQHPDKSYEALDVMVAHVESIIKKLELPYRLLRLCGGDTSFTAALTFDFEVYSAGQDKWLEVSSVSNFESYQANRLKLRFKEKNEKKTQLAHTLNGSALALPRMVAALLENNQCAEGIRIPKALIPYTGFDMID
ncbi:serine--tRNA ligase [Ancylomarina sp.]|uniref:serine--tRNA ligase n=1 Tax=Ancylomarina sp. TaxID=1970196 RepID=UPI003563298F